MVSNATSSLLFTLTEMFKVAVILGELIGRYLNDWIMNYSIRRNKGVFEAESRLWYVYFCIAVLANLNLDSRACYVAVPLYICGFVTLGAAIQNFLSVGAIIIGWGLAYVAIMIGTVAVITYGNDCFPKHQVCGQ